MAPVQNKIYIITFKPDATEADKQGVKNQIVAEDLPGGKIVHDYTALDQLAAELPEELYESFRQGDNSAIQSIEPDGPVEIS
ncbi:hypothetical protein FRC07_001273 [Ceratobasidium sp. 392]|nr:hypothetical protein FRC07_001273 [Ceratobasidium sp. 392]